MDERLPLRMLVNPVVHPPVEGLKELSVGIGTDKRPVLRTEIGAGNEDGRNTIAYDG